MKASRATPLLSATALVLLALAVSFALRKDTPAPAASSPAATMPPAVPAPADADHTPRVAAASRIAVRPFSRSAGDASEFAGPNETTLPGPWILRGLVINAAREPVAGARVFVADPTVFVPFSDKCLLARGWFRASPFERDAPAASPAPRDDSRGGAVAVATTDGAGRFEVALSACRGVASAFASHDEHGDAAVVDVRLSAGSATEVTLSTRAVVSLYGSVTDSATGRPVDMATILIESGTADTGIHARPLQNELVEASDAQGRWLCFPQRAAVLSVTAHPRGYFPASARVVTAPTTKEHRVDLVVDPKPALAGRLIDASGGPAHLAQALADPRLDETCGVSLWLSDTDPLLVPDFGSGRHAEGTVAIPDDTYTGDVSERTEHWISLWYGRKTMLGRAAFDLAHPSPDIVVNTSLITPSASADAGIDVRASDSITGMAIKAFVVRATRLGHDAAGDSSATAVSLPEATATDFEARLTGLASGTYQLVVSADGYATDEDRHIVDPHTTTSHRVLLVPPTAPLPGFVRDAAGGPVAGVALMAFRVHTDGFQQAPSRAGVSGSDGSFVFERLREGDYVLVAHDKAGGRVAKVQVQVNARVSAVDVTLRAGVAVAFEPPEDAGRCWYNISDESTTIWFTDHDDAFSGVGERRTVVLPPGEYVVNCAAAGFEPARVAFTAVSGPTLRVPIRLVALKK